ncbi:hypothetical protein ONZ45_g7267 [Pleurotus djamor]|nr:hypothetical protein ONZ45_g7267 [Pleurotus djamor]
MGDTLYNAVKLQLEQFVVGSAMALEATSCSEQDYVPWLEKFVDTCKWFEDQVALLCSLLTYLDQFYVRADSNLLPIRELAYGKFGDRVFTSHLIIKWLRLGTKFLINNERHLWINQSDHRQLMSSVVSHLITHDKYDAFEKHYLTFTTEWYLEESKTLSVELTDAKAFFKKMDLRIEYESDLVKEVLPVGTWGIARQATERALMKERGEWLAKEALGAMMKEQDLAMLGKMYKLFRKVDTLESLRSSLRSYVSTSVKAIVTDIANDDTMIPKLLEFKANSDKTIQKSFVVGPPNVSESGESSSTLDPPVPDKNFIYALDEGFRIGFQARRRKPAELIAKHLDKIMRKGQGASSDAAFRALLDSVLALYRYTEDKDVFRRFYHRSLAKRLLLDKSASDDFEKEMLKKLREQYDAQFDMAEDMFKDLNLSKELMAGFDDKFMKAHPDKPLTVSVMVLQPSAWPFALSKKTLPLPPAMEADLQEFTAYYQTKHKNRTLNWEHALGTATLKGRFAPGSKDLSVSLYQALVLLLFNDAEELPFVEIKMQVPLDDDELRRTLQSLACGKLKVLKKVPHGKDVGDRDVFKFNADFSDARAKVHINSIQAKVTVDESKSTHALIDGERMHSIDAAVVRIMKANKEMKLEKIVQETVDSLQRHFIPDVPSIKRQIESLVDREYLCRDAQDKKLFRYLA